MTTVKNPETGKLERPVYTKTVTLDAESREVAMRKQFVKAGRYLVKQGQCLNSLLKEVYRDQTDT